MLVLLDLFHKRTEMFRRFKEALIQWLVGDKMEDRLDAAIMLLPECDVQTDNQRQLIVYTGMMYAGPTDDAIVPFEAQSMEDQ